MSIRTINDNTWHCFGLAMLGKVAGGPDKEKVQKQFLENCNEHHSLRGFLQCHSVGFQDGEPAHMPYGRLSPSEFAKFSDFDAEWDAWVTLRELPIDTLTSFGFWAQLTLDAIDQGLIMAPCLALGQNVADGEKAIETAIRDEGKRDDVVRRILLSLCNDAPRGKRVIYVNQPLSRSFWKMYWANEITDELHEKYDANTPLEDKKDAIREVHAVMSGKFYAKIAEKLYSTRSYISHVSIYAGLVSFLMQHSEEEKEIDKKINRMIDIISFYMSWKALEAQSHGDNLILIKEIYRNAKENEETQDQP